ncbi:MULTISPECIES: ACT domain-containing protein [Kocuria]|uniref:ACT domain-containing protein n=1 Tax=Kocuria TaxID=57493 RepID=UPI0006604A72|nr:MULTISPECIES: ACT domain-containing protein [Kocuria]MCT1368478.1 ACT domain-containing protein [Rothia sp. p3-SID1597]RUQ20932.1 ACT domain-containing protein [Kocuria sp. HSID16901]
MKIILTVTGLDHEGIIAAVSSGLAEQHVNILNVSQTLMENYFTMIMQGEFDEDSQTIEDIQAAMEPVGESAKVKIRIQAESIFQAMHSL